MDALNGITGALEKDGSATVTYKGQNYKCVLVYHYLFPEEIHYYVLFQECDTGAKELSDVLNKYLHEYLAKITEEYCHKNDLVIGEE